MHQNDFKMCVFKHNKNQMQKQLPAVFSVFISSIYKEYKTFFHEVT